jgi:hypothetical protein
MELPWYIWLLGISIVSVYAWALISSISEKIPSNDDYYWW